MADADGNCTRHADRPDGGGTYKIAQNDFTASGGDGYPNFASRQTTQDIMEQVTADYITAHSPLTPFVKAAPDEGSTARTATACRCVGPQLPDVGSVSVRTRAGGPPRTAVGRRRPQ